MGQNGGWTQGSLVRALGDLQATPTTGCMGCSAHCRKLEAAYVLARGRADRLYCIVSTAKKLGTSSGFAKGIFMGKTKAQTSDTVL